jgi:L-amino acid N-acyltransferase YncA
MTNTLLRPCALDDVPAIAAIYAHAVRYGRASFELEAPTLEEMIRRRAVLVDGGFPYLVAEQDGAVVGYAYAGPYRPRPAYCNTVENSVYVHPDCHGQGLGNLLLGGVIAEATRLGFRQMIAVIGDSANRPSIRLHERHGFRLIGVVEAVGWKHGQWLDTVLMQRSLGAGMSRAPDMAGTP